MISPLTRVCSTRMRSRVCMHVRVERTHAHVYLPNFSGGMAKIVSNSLISNVKNYPQGLGVVGVFGRFCAKTLYKLLIYNGFCNSYRTAPRNPEFFNPLILLSFKIPPLLGVGCHPLAPPTPDPAPFPRNVPARILRARTRGAAAATPPPPHPRVRPANSPHLSHRGALRPDTPARSAVGRPAHRLPSRAA